MNTTDGELLRRYLRDHSEAAFEEIVRRHVGLVYAAALRQMNNDAHQAQDVTQIVFTGLARKAAKLIRHTSLAGWLYTSIRYAAAGMRRTDQRRNLREREAQAMHAIQSPEPQPDWTQISPILDDAMHHLPEKDREAVLLRHFERQSYLEIGGHLGISENAARMRVDRALSKLQTMLAKRGLTSTALTLAAALSTNAVGVAPTALASDIARKALIEAAAGGVTLTVTNFFASWTVKIAAALLVVTLGLTIFMTLRNKAKIVAEEVGELRVRKNPDPLTAPESDPAVFANRPAVDSGMIGIGSNSRLRLEILAADSGKPIPLVNVFYPTPEIKLEASGFKFSMAQRTSDRLGFCDIPIPEKVPALNIALQIEGFADTWLTWEPFRGDVIPTNFVVRLERAVPISGTVVDAHDNPVPGAKVSWSINGNSPPSKLPQHAGFYSEKSFSYQFGVLEAFTDATGHWEVNRISADSLPMCYGRAEQSNYVGSAGIAVGTTPEIEKKLREGTFVFRLQTGVTVSGDVVNEAGEPVPDANIIIGDRFDVNARQCRSEKDGTFRVEGCEAGQRFATAEADGYAPSTIATKIDSSSLPLHLILHRGKTVRFTMVDRSGSPVPGAYVTTDYSDNPLPAQPYFAGVAEADGQVVWTNAPQETVKLNVMASGFITQAVEVDSDEEMKSVTLSRETKIQGIVRDQVTGAPVRNFRITVGWPDGERTEGNIRWDLTDSSRFNFPDGRYSQLLGQIDTNEKTLVLKCEADGYAVWISRELALTSESLNLDIAMRPEKGVRVVVYKPDGTLARNVDIGLASVGLKLPVNAGRLVRGGPVALSPLLRQCDANGEFELPADDSITRIIAVDPDGFAQGTPAGLRDNPILAMQPWGGLEVSCVSSGKPASGHDYQLDFSGGIFDFIAFEPKLKVRTDTFGKFVISRLPPGTHQLTREQLEKLLSFDNWLPVDKTEFTIRPGEITALNLGDSNCTVAAKLIWPPEVQRSARLQMIARLQTPRPPLPSEAMTNEAARNAFYNSPQMRAAVKDRREYALSLQDANRLIAHEVEPGSYEMEVLFGEVITNSYAGGRLQMSINRIAEGKATVTVPADVQNGFFDAGEIRLSRSASPSVRQAN